MDMTKEQHSPDGFCYHCTDCHENSIMVHFAFSHSAEKGHGVFQRVRSECNIHMGMLVQFESSTPTPSPVKAVPTIECPICHDQVQGYTDDHKHYDPEVKNFVEVKKQ